MGHHYVSEFYLEEFTYNDEKTLIYSMSATTGKIPMKANNIGDICQKKNYNTPQQECRQSQLEGKYAVALRNFIKSADKDIYDFSKEVKKVEKNVFFSDEFIEFVSFMLGNNIYTRETLGSAYSLENILPSVAELHNNIVMDNEYRRKFDWSQSFSDMTYKAFKNWELGFVRLDPKNSRSYFITSDNPVGVFDPENVNNSIDNALC